ncbi:Uncharacterised protein [Klebsiella pneumoniae]|nr:Uncharacterised protein [Klebsiella pneumoniae]
MTDDQNNDARDMWAEALSSLFRAAPRDELFRISDDEIDALEGLSPDRWPTAGQTDINWDLSVPGHRHTIDLPDPRVLQPADCEQIDLSSLVLGKASFADFDPLLHSCFRLTDSGLWVELTNPKLERPYCILQKDGLFHLSCYLCTKMVDFISGTGPIVMRY